MIIHFHHPTKNSTVSNIITTSIVLLLSYILNYGLNVYLAHYLSPANYGNFSIALKVLTLITTFMLMGTNMSVHRFFSHYFHDKKYTQVFSYLAWNFEFISRNFKYCLLLTILLFLGILIDHYANLKLFSSYRLAIYFLFLAPISSLALLFSCLLVGIGKNILSSFIYNVVKYGLLLGLFITTFTLLKFSSTDFLIVIVFFLALLLIFLIQLWFLNINLGKKFINTLRDLIYPPKKHLQWQSVSLKLALSSLIYLLIQMIDLIIIKNVSSNQANVGYYSAICIIIGFFPSISTAAYQAIRPLVTSDLESAQGKKLLNTKLRTANITYFLILLCFAAVIIVFGQAILGYFGANYVHAYPVLVVSIISMLITCIAAGPAMLLVYGRGESYVLAINMIELSVLMLFGIILTYQHGILGMAYANLIASIVCTSLTVIIVRKKLKIKSLSIF